MKLQKLLLAASLISLVSLTDISSQPRPRQRRPSYPRPLQRKAARPRPQETTIESSSVELVLRYNFSTPSETSRIDFVVAVPRTIPNRQRILSIKYSPRPSNVFRRNGNRYAQFVFDEPKKRLKVEMTIKAELFKYDLSVARKKEPKRLAKGPGFKDFLNQEEYIEKDHPQIQEAAENIEGNTEVSTVKKIYDYVVDNMEYTIPGKKALGAVKALEQKKGDCSEYSDLFVAICRAKNIPARVITGYTVRFDDVSPKHHWVEVYLQKYGWVPFDPSWGDVDNVLVRHRTFGTMQPVYIYLTHIRNDEVLHNNHFYTYSFWGDKVELKDSVEFKQPAEPRLKPGK
jgi:transglutaminase-like putative cysteine protease